MQTVSKQSMASHRMSADPFLVDTNSKHVHSEQYRNGQTMSGLPEPSGHHTTHISSVYESPAPPPGLSCPSGHLQQQQRQAPSYRVSPGESSLDTASPPTLALNAPRSGSPKKPSNVATHQSRNSISKAANLPFLNLASLKNYSAFGSPVKPPTPLAVPPTPLSHPSSQDQPTPTHGVQGGSGKFLGALKLMRSDAAISGAQASKGTLHPFALPSSEPQQYICYNLDARGSSSPEASPLSPPPTPNGQAVPHNATQSPNGASSMVLCTPPPAKPLPAPAQLPPPKADKPGSIPTCAKFLADGRLNAQFEQQYEILDELGSGGFGFVIRARRRFDGLIVAVKFIFRERVGLASDLYRQ